MRKTYGLHLILVALLSTGCGGPSETKTPTNSPSSTSRLEVPVVSRDMKEKLEKEAYQIAEGITIEQPTWDGEYLRVDCNRDVSKLVSKGEAKITLKIKNDSRGYETEVKRTANLAWPSSHIVRYVADDPKTCFFHADEIWGKNDRFSVQVLNLEITKWTRTGDGKTYSRWKGSFTCEDDY